MSAAKSPMLDPPKPEPAPGVELTGIGGSSGDNGARSRAPARTVAAGIGRVVTSPAADGAPASVSTLVDRAVGAAVIEWAAGAAVIERVAGAAVRAAMDVDVTP